MKTVYGDIFKELELNNADVFVHGCNCFCNMGAGIALDVKKRFPEAYLADLETKTGSHEKLGTYSQAIVTHNGRQIIIVNAYTQYDWRGNGKDILADYSAIRHVFRAIKTNFNGLRIVYPTIGAGLAKGKWNIIEQIIDEELSGEHHFCVRLPNNGHKKSQSD